MEQLVRQQPNPQAHDAVPTTLMGTTGTAHRPNKYLLSTPTMCQAPKRGSDMAPELPLKMSKASSPAPSNLILIKPSDVKCCYPHLKMGLAKVRRKAQGHKTST